MDDKSKNEETVTISIEEYNELIGDSLFLYALMANGVDNWCGYEDAQDAYNDMKEQ